MTVVYDPHVVFDKIGALIESDPEMYSEGFQNGFDAYVEDPSIDATEAIDAFPRIFNETEDTESAEFKQRDFVHTVGLFFGFVMAKTTVVEGVTHE